MQATISFTLEELAGVSQDVIDGYTKRTDGDKELYDVTYKTPDIFPIVSNPMLDLDLVNLLQSPSVQIRSEPRDPQACL